MGFYDDVNFCCTTFFWLLGYTHNIFNVYMPKKLRSMFKLIQPFIIFTVFSINTSMNIMASGILSKLQSRLKEYLRKKYKKYTASTCCQLTHLINEFLFIIVRKTVPHQILKFIPDVIVSAFLYFLIYLTAIYCFCTVFYSIASYIFEILQSINEYFNPEIVKKREALREAAM